jgi:hypothetical protein
MWSSIFPRLSPDPLLVNSMRASSQEVNFYKSFVYHTAKSLFFESMQWERVLYSFHHAGSTPPCFSLTSSASA